MSFTMKSMPIEAKASLASCRIMNVGWSPWPPPPMLHWKLGTPSALSLTPAGAAVTLPSATGEGRRPSNQLRAPWRAAA